MPGRSSPPSLPGLLLLDQPSVGVEHDQTSAPDLDGCEPAVADHLVYRVLPETGEDAKLVNRCGNGIGCRRKCKLILLQHPAPPRRRRPNLRKLRAHRRVSMPMPASRILARRNGMWQFRREEKTICRLSNG